MDDVIIIRRVLEGEVDAFALLVERYHRNLLSFIFRIVRDAHLAEDIGQEVFLNVYRELSHFDPKRGTPFAAWLFIVARNLSVSELRRQGRRQTVSAECLDLLPAIGESVECSLIRQEELELLKESLKELPEPFRATIVLSLKGDKVEDIAKRMGVAEGTVKTRLFRARERLALLFKGHFGGVGHERGI